jgi:hypothetical protein
MSRHSHFLQQGDDSVELVAGFDRPLQCYFAHKYINGDCVYAISPDPLSILTPHPNYPPNKRWGQLELAELLEQEGAPAEWTTAIRLDLPF